MTNPEDVERRWRERHEDVERRARIDMEVAQRLEISQRDFQFLKEMCGKLRADLDQAVQTGKERGWAIKRTEEKIAEMSADLKDIKAHYVGKEDHERALAPFKKWATWIATLVFGAVATALLALVVGKGSVH